MVRRTIASLSPLTQNAVRDVRECMSGGWKLMGEREEGRGVIAVHEVFPFLPRLASDMMAELVRRFSG